ncbi:MAG: sigma-70 family RNA polymerase sigma factor [Planctomycetota bacterium]|nr:sigma-70 family RNA polymerase sigma factor [Planctomycetota bacterium]
MPDSPNRDPETDEPAPGEDSSDGVLAAEALDGDALARAEVERRLGCVPRFLGFRNKRSGRPFGHEELSDLAQDVFVLIWSKLGGFEGRSKLETWVYRICAYEFLNALRRKQRQNARTADLGPDASMDDMAQPASKQPDPSHFEGLHKAMGQLPADEERVLSMKHYDDLTFAEIGQALGLSTSGAKHQYYKAMEHLTRLLRANRGSRDE